MRALIAPVPLTLAAVLPQPALASYAVFRPGPLRVAATDPLERRNVPRDRHVEWRIADDLIRFFLPEQQVVARVVQRIATQQLVISNALQIARPGDRRLRLQSKRRLC